MNLRVYSTSAMLTARLRKSVDPHVLLVGVGGFYCSQSFRGGSYGVESSTCDLRLCCDLGVVVVSLGSGAFEFGDWL